MEKAIAQYYGLAAAAPERHSVRAQRHQPLHQLRGKMDTLALNRSTAPSQHLSGRLVSQYDAILA